MKVVSGGGRCGRCASRVPLMAGAGYAFGDGAGDFLERLRRWLGPLWLATLFAATVGTLLIFGRRVIRYRAGREE